MKIGNDKLHNYTYYYMVEYNMALFCAVEEFSVFLHKRKNNNSKRVEMKEEKKRGDKMSGF